MNFVQFITTKRFLKHFGYSVLLTIVIVWITMLFLKMYTRHEKIAVTPKYIGLLINQVYSLESSKDFNIIIVDSIYDYKRTPGSVISQDPLPGTRVKPGRNVYLSLVSFVPEQISMPAMVDLSLRQAKALLQTYGLKLGSIKVVPDIAENAVLHVYVNSREARPGIMVRKGSVVDFVVGSGSGGGEASIPFLIGKTHSEAVGILARSGFILGNETFDGDCDSLSGQIYQQTPVYVYGKKAAAGTSFTLTYRSSADFDFDEYINNLVIDTLQTEEPAP